MNHAPFALRLAFAALAAVPCSSAAAESELVPIAEGWARNSVNVPVFRRNSVVTHGDVQYVAFYDAEGSVVLAKRALGSRAWEIAKTQHSGNVKDAHNSISIMADGEGFLHMSWDHHGNALRYCRSTAARSLDRGPMMPMTGADENSVTYPEFHRLANGNLLFVYRSGNSGNGDLMMNRYDAATKEWSRVQSGLVGGEGRRNAYWTARDLTKTSVGLWKPSYDTELWWTKKQLHLFAQRVGQGDGKRTEDVPPQTVSVLDWKP